MWNIHSKNKNRCLILSSPTTVMCHVKMELIQEALQALNWVMPWCDHPSLVNTLVPWSLLILQQFVELLELLHGLVLQIRIGDLQADAVCGPRELTGEHLSQDPRHYRYNLNERDRKWEDADSISVQDQKI